MRKLNNNLSASLYTPKRLNPLSLSFNLDQSQKLNDIAAIQRLFANGENGGYWPADPAYLYEDSAGTIPASVNGVCGLWMDHSRGSVAQARRNLLTYTEDFSNSAWYKSFVTVIPNAITAPDVTLTADKLIDTTSTGFHYSEQTGLTTTNQTYTYSIYVRGGETTTFRLTIVHVGLESTTTDVDFSITDRVIAFVSGTINSVFIYLSVRITPDREGFYRIQFSYTLSGTVTSHRVRNYVKQGASYAGDGTSGIYIWGAQLEVGASATPYQKIITGTGDLLPGNHAYQQTTANKPYLRRTPVSNKYWLDSNTATGALTATFASALGSACTIATVGPEGVTIAENQTVGSTYNITPAWGYSSDILIINRALTVAEKAIVTRHFNRQKPAYGSLQNAIPQIRGYVTNNEMVPDWAARTSFEAFWWNGGLYMTEFPFINTSNCTNFRDAFRSSKITAFPPLAMNKSTNFYAAWFGCVDLSFFPPGLFDNWTGVPNSICFINSWGSCTALTESSVKNIIVSIAASGQSATVSNSVIGLDGAPSLATIQVNSTIMAAVTTLKSRNWTPTYKGTAL